MTTAPPSAQAMSLLATYGDTGLKAYGGYVTEEHLTELTGQKGRAVYRRMAVDPTCAAVLGAVKGLIKAAEWSVQAADDSDDAAEAKDWLERALDDMDTPMADVLSEACTMFEFGWAACEVTYKRRLGREPGQDEDGEPLPSSKHQDGALGIHEIALRAQTSLINWDLSPKDGRVLGLRQLATWKRGQVYIPRRKLALFRMDSVKGNPESTSLLRPCYQPWYYKTKMQEIEAIGAERNNAGLPLIKIPGEFLEPSAAPEQKAFAAAMAELGKRIRRDQQDFIMVASDLRANGTPLVEVQLLTPAGKTFDISGVIQRHDQSIARAVLAQWIFLGSGPTGSFALSSDQTDLFAKVLKQYADRIASTFNRDIIEVLWEANGFPPETCPKLAFSDFEKANVALMVQTVSSLAGLGDVIDRDTINAVRKAAGLPLAPETGQGADLADQGLPGQDEWALPPRKAEANNKEKTP